MFNTSVYACLWISCGRMIECVCVRLAVHVLGMQCVYIVLCGPNLSKGSVRKSTFTLPAEFKLGPLRKLSEFLKKKVLEKS